MILTPIMLADIGRNAAKGKCTFPVLHFRVCPLSSLICGALARIHHIMSHKSDISNREDFRATRIAKKKKDASFQVIPRQRPCGCGWEPSPPDRQERGGHDWSCDTGQNRYKQQLFNCPSVCRSAALMSSHIWRFENQRLLPVFP